MLAFVGARKTVLWSESIHGTLPARHRMLFSVARNAGRVLQPCSVQQRLLTKPAACRSFGMITRLFTRPRATSHPDRRLLPSCSIVAGHSWTWIRAVRSRDERQSRKSGEFGALQCSATSGSHFKGPMPPTCFDQMRSCEDALYHRPRGRNG